MLRNSVGMETINLLYGIPANETERYAEVLLGTGSPERLAKIRGLATRDGFHSFRQAVHVDGSMPNFIRSISR